MTSDRQQQEPTSGATPFAGSRSGLTRQQLRARRYSRLARDVYLLVDRPVELVDRCRALQVAVPDAVVSHATAAVLLGLPVREEAAVHVTRPAGRAPVRRAGVVPHVRDLGPEEVVVHAGVRLTTPVRTLLDVAASVGGDDLVVLADAVARRVGVDRLRAQVGAAPRRRGLVRARAAVALADPGAESPAETRTRVLLHRAGFRGLRHGVVVTDVHGGWCSAPDLADPEARVAVQYDGLVHLERGARRWQSDIDRDELTRAAGWQVVVLTGRDLARPHLAVQKVGAAYERAALVGLPPPLRG